VLVIPILVESTHTSVCTSACNRHCRAVASQSAKSLSILRTSACAHRASAGSYAAYLTTAHTHASIAGMCYG
jgi:hypothetical protein